MEESSFSMDRMGPGMPVPLPAFWFDPSMSLTRWNSQLNVPMAIFSGTFFPTRAFSGNNSLMKLPSVSVP